MSLPLRYIISPRDAGSRPPKTVNDTADPQYGFIISGKKIVKRVDGDDNVSVESLETPGGLPKTVNRVFKAEHYPHLMYEMPRKDVIKFVRESSSLDAEDIALKPVGDGYVGIFFDKNLTPYLFSMKSLGGFKMRPARDVHKATTIYNNMLEEENRKSLKIMRKETSRALSDFAERLSKAFPVQKEQKVKQAPKMIGAGTKKTGAGGKPRYSYKQQGKEKGQPGAKGTPAKKPPASPGAKPGGSTDAVTPAPEQKPVVDPNKMAMTLKTTPEVLRKIAMRFASNQKLGGCEGFVKFFKVKFPELLKKHTVTSHYLRLLFAALTQPQQPQPGAQ